MEEVERNEYIDWLKGFAIILVVVGHCWLVSKGTFWLIYRFHMPLFLCISGYLFKNKKNFKEFFKSKCKTLLIPYVIYFIISFLVCITILNKNISINKMLKYLLLNGKYCSRVDNWAIWYLPLFFIASIIFYWISKIKNKKVFIAIILICGFITVPVNNVLQSLVKNSFIVTTISIVLFIIGIIMSINNNNQIINITTYRYLIAALLIIQFIIYITKNNKNKAIIYIGKNSLIILGIHRIILKVMEYYKLGEFLKQYNITGDIAAILVTCLCIVIICLVNEIINYMKRLIISIKDKKVNKVLVK